MGTKTILEKLPQLIDYALAVAINSIPGISETDNCNPPSIPSLSPLHHPGSEICKHLIILF